MRQFYLLLALAYSLTAFTQVKTNFRIAFYNVENIFHPSDEAGKMDEAFTPEGSYHWTPKKYKDKLARVAKVIGAVGEWDQLAIIGICEVENRQVVEDLVHKSPLQHRNYRYIHYESPDARGIDVALLYDSLQFHPISHTNIQVDFPQSNRKTRDLLYVKGEFPQGDSLHVFVCHAPSRLGGELASAPKRAYVMSIVRMHIDSIFASEEQANVLVMGDFNDHPSNKSIREVLKAQPVGNAFKSNELYNLYDQFDQDPALGTHKYQADWGVLDQMMVSGSLLSSATFYTHVTQAYIYKAEFLLEADRKYTGEKPFRTFLGMRYLGGFSDHLPIYVDFSYLKKEK